MQHIFTQIRRVLLRWKTILLIIIGVLPFGVIVYMTLVYISFDVSSVLYAQEGIVIKDVYGEQLDILDTGREFIPVSYDQIPESCVQALVATEDSSFFSHIGVDWRGLVRGAAAEVTGNSSGASTLTQQLVKVSRYGEARSPIIKFNEAIQAVKVDANMSKEDILVNYLNQVNFGNAVYGIGSAAEMYFGKSVPNLRPHECAYLTGVINKPAVFNPYASLELGRERQGLVLSMMQENGYITAEEKKLFEDLELNFLPLRNEIRAPHAVAEIEKEFEQILKESEIDRDEIKSINTTYNYSAHKEILAFAQNHVESLSAYGADNAGIVALQDDGGVEIMVGSINYFDPDHGVFNHTKSKIQVASTMKPFFYAFAFSEGYLPSSIVMDEEVSFIFSDTAPEFIPQNADKEVHGLQTFRTALGNSYNIPVMVLTERLGVGAFVSFLENFRFTSLQDPLECGLVVSVGACEMTLLDLTRGYHIMSQDGLIYEPYFIEKIRNRDGEVMWSREDKLVEVNTVPQGVQKSIQMVTDILADNDARRVEFGSLSVLRTPFPSAAKTGTTQNHKDTLTIGYTPQKTVGVWVGNSEGVYMQGLYGSDSAAPIWNYAINSLNEGAEEFSREFLGSVERCADLIGTREYPSDISPYEFNRGIPPRVGCQQIVTDVE